MTDRPLPPLPTKWSDMDPYLKAIHLQGKIATVTIERLEFHNTHPKPGVEEIVMVAYFKGKNKGLILNETNKTFLRENFGDTVKECIGKTVTLNPTKKMIAGSMKEFILFSLPRAVKP